MPEKTKKFKTEVKQLLDIVVHSLYSNKEVFLRELIANAADAIDKARFESLTNQDIARDWKIKIVPDKTKKTLSVIDNGIGMTEDEVISNIGTIAKSGTKAFLEAVEKAKKENIPELIGQFGVGFYSVFMVAEKVEIETKRANSDAPAVRWTSQGKTNYTVEECEKSDQGTVITLYLKESESVYLEEWKIREIVKKYSDFIEYPIVMPVKKKNKDESETIEEETLNSMKAIWLKSPSEIKEEEYKTFYSHLSHFDTEPLHYIHYNAEGLTEFKSLIYIPSTPPFDLFFPEARKKSLQLYVRRIFITDNCPGLIPEYLRFLKGVVESNDLPLNISRETLQDNPEIKKIGKNIVKKVLDELKKIKEKDKEKYLKFYKAFGKVLKEGLHFASEDKDRLKELVMYETMKNEPGKLITLKEYVTTMPPEQKEIYYIVGESRQLLENSPHLEFIKSKGYDVLFMTDPVDEFAIQGLFEYDGKKFKALGKGELELDEDTKKKIKEKTEKAEKQHKTLLEFLKKVLEDKVKDVKFSGRLVDSACCLVGGEYDPSPYMERLFKAMNQPTPPVKKTLELNPEHRLIKAMQNLYNKDKEDPRLKDFAEILYDQALLTEGNPIPDPLAFTKKMAEIMANSISDTT